MDLKGSNLAAYDTALTMVNQNEWLHIKDISKSLMLKKFYFSSLYVGASLKTCGLSSVYFSFSSVSFVYISFFNLKRKLNFKCSIRKYIDIYLVFLCYIVIILILFNKKELLIIFQL